MGRQRGLSFCSGDIGDKGSRTSSGPPRVIDRSSSLGAIPGDSGTELGAPGEPQQGFPGSPGPKGMALLREGIGSARRGLRWKRSPL